MPQRCLYQDLFAFWGCGMRCSASWARQENMGQKVGKNRVGGRCLRLWRRSPRHAGVGLLLKQHGRLYAQGAQATRSKGIGRAGQSPSREKLCAILYACLLRGSCTHDIGITLTWPKQDFACPLLTKGTRRLDHLAGLEPGLAGAGMCVALQCGCRRSTSTFLPCQSKTELLYLDHGNNPAEVHTAGDSVATQQPRQRPGPDPHAARPTSRLRAIEIY